MNDVVQFCDKTIDVTTIKVTTTESSLKIDKNQELLKAIQTDIKINETTAKKILKQQKNKNSMFRHINRKLTLSLTRPEDGLQEKNKKSSLI